MAAGSKVLVVDDNAQNRALAQATLEDDGYHVILAKDGVEGLAAFEREQPDCLLLDIQMPGLDGVTVCERIRALPRGDITAIVFVTAQRDIAIFDRALAAGGDDFLTKPFRPSELVVRVQTALRLRKLAGERSDLFDEVKRQRDDLQRLQLQKDQLVGFLVHDLKNPVNSIELQAERLLRDRDVTERTRSVGNAIRSETRSLMRMILNLLDLGRGDEGRLVPNREPIELSSHATAVLDEFRVVAAVSHVELLADVRASRPLSADVGLVHRVLANLVENALRHSPEAGKVTISIVQDAEHTEVRVADVGPGVPENRRRTVFQRFESSGGATSRGLGLAFCKLAVEAHGGKIWIEDAGPGAIFCVRFPDAHP